MATPFSRINAYSALPARPSSGQTPLHPHPRREATIALAATPLPHLVNWRDANAKRQGAIKWGVLTELGRAAREQRPDVVMVMAKRIHAALSDGTVANTKEAERQVRAWRKRLKEAAR